jgi:hypothetical protein
MRRRQPDLHWQESLGGLVIRPIDPITGAEILVSSAKPEACLR